MPLWSRQYWVFWSVRKKMACPVMRLFSSNESLLLTPLCRKVHTLIETLMGLAIACSVNSWTFKAWFQENIFLWPFVYSKCTYPWLPLKNTSHVYEITLQFQNCYNGLLITVTDAPPVGRKPKVTTTFSHFSPLSLFSFFQEKYLSWYLLKMLHLH